MDPFLVFVKQICDSVPNVVVELFNREMSVRPHTVEYLLTLDDEARALVAYACTPAIVDLSAVDHGDEDTVDESDYDETYASSSHYLALALMDAIIASLIGDIRAGCVVLYRGFKVAIPLELLPNDFILSRLIPTNVVSSDATEHLQ